MKKIGRYNIIAELGRGAMGIVYKASDPTIGREVALKVLSLNASPEEGANSPQQMFMREVRAAGRLAHPSIVTIHDAFDDPETQTSCIVMEMVPGLTLEKILNSGRVLTTEQVLDLVRQVAEGLDYAHRNQVIHRDLKPANILVTEDGRAKITDFGIAKVLAREGVARTVGVMGTPSYMSPEQVKGGEIDARTDIFSLGIMIFTMLTGRKPFAGNTAAVMFQIVYEEPPETSSLNPQLTPAHDYVVKKCLAKDRDKRYSSARELLGDLDDLQHDRPLRSQASTPAPEAAPPTPAEAAPSDRTMAMPIPSLMRAASQPQPPAPRPTPPAPPPATSPDAGGPGAPPAIDRTVAMPIPGLMRAASQPQPPAPRPAPPAPSPATSPDAGGPGAPPAIDRTVAMPIPGLMKAASQPQPPAPRPTPSAAPPATPPEAGGPGAPPPIDRTVAMPIPGLMKAASQPQPPAPRPAPPAPPPATPPEAGGPGAPPAIDRTMAMPIPGLMKAASQPQPPAPRPAPPAPPPARAQPPKPVVPPPAKPAAAPEARPLTRQSLPMQAPDHSGRAPSVPLPPPVTPARPAPKQPLMERTLPMQVPDLSAASLAAPSAVPAAPPPPAPSVSPPMEGTAPMQAPDLSAAPQAAGPAPPVLPSQPVAEPALEPEETPGTLLPAPKSKLLPAVLGGVAIVLLGAGMWGYWKFHQTRTAPAPLRQVAVQTPRATPPPASTPLATPAPVETPNPTPTPQAEKPTPPASAAQKVAKKTAAPKPKPGAAPPAAAPAPTPPPAQPQPVVVTPSPQPSPATPSPEDIAKAEAARLAKIPRIVKVVCNFGLKEATLVFSAGGNPLFEEALKGKKAKGGFLGIKGSYQGTFSHTITVPAGMSEVSVRVLTKDGATDLTKAIQMPAPGGFVPTLAVEVDSDHLSLNWQSSSASK